MPNLVSDSTSKIPQKLASLLVGAYSKIDESDRPKQRELRYSRFIGMTEAASALGLGTTSQSVHMAVRDSFDVHGLRPPASREERTAWIAKVIATLMETTLI